jgi:leucyl-tRNA synthetase
MLKITEKFGSKKTTYKIRDWVFSRQRYWGEPIPIIHCEKCGIVSVPYRDLPVKLPEVKHYEPTGTGESPLASIEKWVNVTCPKCHGKARRETNTMPQWAGSSWYWLRYMDPKNKKALVDKKREKYWAPVDLYVGGAEHATRHLIYGRFWHKFLYDIGVVSTVEPFTRLISVGLIQAEDGRKMSKRFGNVINPDDIVATYGADSLRVYEMFMGPFADAIAWKTSSLIGARRFLERVWRLQEALIMKVDESVEAALHKTIKKIGDDIAAFKFNTAISQMMIFVNTAEEKGITKAQYLKFLAILAPFAPHIAEDIWRSFGNKKSIHVSPWPKYDPAKLVASRATIVVQINGKARTDVEMDFDASQDAVRPIAESRAQKWIGEQPIRRVIFVPNRLINFVIG